MEGQIVALVAGPRLAEIGVLLVALVVYHGLALLRR